MMNNSALSGLRYTGIVKLSQYINGKKRTIGKIKNTGGTPLFDFFIDCLVGNYNAAQFNRPTKIMLLNQTTDDSSALELTPASGFIYMINRPEKVSSSEIFAEDSDISEISSVACLSFLIPANAINETFTHIGLYADPISIDDLFSYAALLPINNADFNFTSESVLLLDWYLIITNS